MLTKSYSLPQNRSLTLNTPPLIGTVAGDNPTPFYLHFPDLAPGFQWVFPFTYGFVYPLAQVQAQVVQVSSSDTPDGFPAAPTSSALATLITYDVQLPYSPGRQAFPAGQWTKIGSKTLAAGADTLTSDTVPPTTKTIGILVESGPTGIIPTHLDGAISGTRYYAPLIPAGQAVQGFVMIPVDGLRDQSFVLTVATGNSLTVSLWATDALVATISQGYAAPGFSVPVFVSGGQAGSPIFSQDVSTASAVSSGAIGGAGTLVTASGGKTVQLFTIVVAVTAAVAGSEVQIQDSSGTSLATFGAAALGTFAFDFKGLKLATGLGVQAVLAGGAPTVRTSLIYSQV